jgi:hypothetical protein
MKKTIEGSGVGSVYSWSGNDQVGEGKMTLTESVPDSRVAMKLEFIKPWAAVNDVEILLAPASDGTEVMWAMNGTHNFLSKAMCVFMDMDQMMGKDFESGLSNLKSLAESAPPVEAAPADSAAASAS